MTRFRFRYKRLGYLRWRCRARRRPAMWDWLPPADIKAKPSAAAWRRIFPKVETLAPCQAELRVGDFVVGEHGDPQLQGHPDIRY